MNGNINTWNIRTRITSVSYGILNPMVNWTRGQFTSMVYWTPLLKTEPPLYGKLNPHGILNPPISNQKICREVKISCAGAYPWYIEPLTHGISTPLSMIFWPPLPIEYRPPYTWYFDLPAYLLIRNGGVQNTMGVQFTIQGGFSFQ
jgi:hypothetical protein